MHFPGWPIHSETIFTRLIEQTSYYSCILLMLNSFISHLLCGRSHTRQFKMCVDLFSFSSPWWQNCERIPETSLPKKLLRMTTHNPILLNIENNDPFPLVIAYPNRLIPTK
jgi:hypothetical protein